MRYVLILVLLFFSMQISAQVLDDVEIEINKSITNELPEVSKPYNVASLVPIARPELPPVTFGELPDYSFTPALVTYSFPYVLQAQSSPENFVEAAVGSRLSTYARGKYQFVGEDFVARANLNHFGIGRGPVGADSSSASLTRLDGALAYRVNQNSAVTLQLNGLRRGFNRYADGTQFVPITELDSQQTAFSELAGQAYVGFNTQSDNGRITSKNALGIDGSTAFRLHLHTRNTFLLDDFTLYANLQLWKPFQVEKVGESNQEPVSTSLKLAYGKSISDRVTIKAGLGMAVPNNLTTIQSDTTVLESPSFIPFPTVVVNYSNQSLLLEFEADGELNYIGTHQQTLVNPFPFQVFVTDLFRYTIQGKVFKEFARLGVGAKAGVNLYDRYATWNSVFINNRVENQFVRTRDSTSLPFESSWFPVAFANASGQFRLNDNLNFSLDYTFQSSIMSEKPLGSNVPQHSLQLGSKIKPLENLSIQPSLGLLAFSGVEGAGFSASRTAFDLSLKGSYQFSDFYLLAQFVNLTNASYQLVYGYENAGITLQIGAGWLF